MKTYRYSGHSRSDPAKYRPAGELESWLKRDPIRIFAERLVAEGAIGPSDPDRFRAETIDAVERAVADVLEAPEPAERDMLLHVTGISGKVSDGVPGQDRREMAG